MKKTIVPIVLILLPLAILAQTFQSKEARLAWWRDARFGMFIHWGPVTLKGKEISWSRGGQIPVREYDSLYLRFNPTQFDAQAWVRIAKAAGMKYMVLTTKHHDGFCLWNSKQTPYNILNTPFQRDVVKELAEACQQQGMPFGVYYSTCDWYHPDFPVTSPGGGKKREKSNIDAYTNYLKRQIAELMLNYGPLATLWFDVPQHFDAKRGQGVIDFARIIQPDILINNRTGAWGDYDTPEQRVGSMQMNRAWESCITIADQWAWKPNDKVKTLQQCLQTLILSAAGDGNLLFNVGPDSLGVIEPLQVKRLEEMGNWLKKNGEAIYGTRGGPYLPGRNIACTRKDSVVYLHVLKWRKGVLSLPNLPTTIQKATLLSGTNVSIQQQNNQLHITLPKAGRDSIATIIKLTLSTPAIDIPLIDPLDDYKATASNVYQKSARFGADMLVDKSTDALSIWRTDDTTRTAWVEIDLRKERTIDQITVNEHGGEHIEQFTLAYKNTKGVWVPLAEGTKIGKAFTLPVKKTVTQYVRLNIVKANAAPSLSEIDIREAD